MAEVSISVNGVPIRLTDERWKHIKARHPEVQEQNEIFEVLSSPDLIQIGDFGGLMAIRKLNHLYFVVVYREISSEDGFVITAYLTERLKERTILWSR